MRHPAAERLRVFKDAPKIIPISNEPCCRDRTEYRLMTSKPRYRIGYVCAASSDEASEPSPEGAQAQHLFDDPLDRVINLFIGRKPAEADPKGSLGELGPHAHSQQDR